MVGRRERFETIIGDLAKVLGGRRLDADLQSFLSNSYPPGGPIFGELADLCRIGIAEGWLCNREQGGVRFGRIIRPGGAAQGFSVDVVQMSDIVGPHHRHPYGEIDMIIPDSPGAEFDSHGKGWLVYEAGSAHRPTVSGGRAIILYLLPGGGIEFT